jgi:hypothetical protein
VQTRTGSTGSLVGLLLAALTLALVVPLSTAAPALASDTVYFEDPSGSVACQIEPPDNETTYQTGVRCDLLTGVPDNSPLPPRQPGCPTDWAPSTYLTEYELPVWGLCVGDSIEGGPSLHSGDVVTSGGITCTALDDGVRCRSTTNGYGFRLKTTSWSPTRPAMKAKLSPNGIGRLKLGMTIKQARRTGYLGPAVCGSPQLKRSLHLGAWLSWSHGRLSGVLANSYAKVEATKHVGPGSTMSQVQDRYRGRTYATRDHVAGERSYVYRVRGSRGQMVFILNTPATRRPAASDLVTAVFLSRQWNPKRGYAFDGC